MNNAINPFVSIPVFQRLEHQQAFRHEGPAQQVPNDRLAPFQFQSPLHDPDLSALVVSTDGLYALRIGARAFDIHLLNNGQYSYTYRADRLSTVLPCGEFYMYINVDVLSYYTERFETVALPHGARVDISMFINDPNLRFRAGITTTETINSYAWEYLVNDSWVSLSADQDNDITVDPSIFTGPHPSIHKIRLRVSTDEWEFTGNSLLYLSDTLSDSVLSRLPGIGAKSEYTDWYCLEYFDTNDRFGISYSQGFRQRIYLRGTFDGVVTESEREIDARPDGTSYLRSVVAKPRQQFKCNEIQDYLSEVLECACDHSNIRLIRQSDDVSYVLEEAEFEPSQGENPLLIEGVISFVNSDNIIYRTGAEESLGAEPV